MDIKDTPLTPSEAWHDFWENVRPGFWNNSKMTKELKNELIVADRTVRGLTLRPNKDGKMVVVNLGLRRMKRLLDLYAPGRYELHAAEPYFTLRKEEE